MNLKLTNVNDVLFEDVDASVRCAVANQSNQGIDLEYILGNDPNCIVRMEAAKQGYSLDELSQDKTQGKKENHAKKKPVRGMFADFEEKHHYGDISSLSLVVEPQGRCHLTPFNYDATGIVIQSTLLGTRVSKGIMW